jgi:hypothetical protein
MPGTSRILTASCVGVLIALGSVPGAHAQHLAAVPPPPGVVSGVVIDERGDPVAGAMVSAVGAVTVFAISDANGRFELTAPAAGAYLIRAHRKGFTAASGRTLDIGSGTRTSSTLTLRRPDPQILAAGVGLISAAQPESEPVEDSSPGASRDGDKPGQQSETAWRLRHARRGILKDAGIATIADDESETHAFAPVDTFGRALESSARLATSFFAETPFSGQVNLLTTSSFDTPRQLFSGNNVARGAAYVRLGAPVGDQGDWMVRGAITETDLTAWLLAGSYRTRAPARHQYEFGMSYSTQRYDGGNQLALRDVSDGSRNAGMVYGLDTFTIAPALSLSYGGRYAQYDYLEHRTLISPRFALTVSPADRFRITTLVSRPAQAPGAEEFLPPSDAGIWLPPQRTFSSLERGEMMDASRAMHVSVSVERDIAASTLAFRAFQQRVDDQLVTLFGIDLPSQPGAKLGHYLIANAGDVTAQGCTASLSTMIAGRLEGSLAYSLATAQMDPAEGMKLLLLVAPSALRPDAERIHDLATTIRADVPETATKVLVLYRLSNAFARAAAQVSDGPLDRPGFDSRFDVQVRQSLPFLDFTSARWEMLVAVRNFFRDTADDQSIYDELLTVRPPKRIVGGVTVHF